MKETLTALASELESDASTATPNDASRLKSLAATLRGRAEKH